MKFWFDVAKLEARKLADQKSGVEVDEDNALEMVWAMMSFHGWFVQQAVTSNLPNQFKSTRYMRSKMKSIFKKCLGRSRDIYLAAL